MKQPLIDLDLSKSSKDRLVPAIPKPDPSDPLGGDWLKTMVPGTVFLAHPTNKPAIVYDNYAVAAHTAKATLLIHLSTGQREYVNSARFCNFNTWVETLGIVEQAPMPEAKEDDDRTEPSDRPNQPV